MKKFLLILFAVFPSYLLAQQTNGPEKAALDHFRLTLTDMFDAAVKPENISLYVDNTRGKEHAPNQGGSGDEGIILSPEKHLFSTIAYYPATGQNVLLLKDKRGKDEYAINYYVDFPLSMENLVVERTYKLSITLSNMSNSAVFFRIIDTENPDDMNVIWENGVIGAGFQFTSNVAKPAGRFIARVYAASLWKNKNNAEDSNWSNPNNWVGGVPGKGALGSKQNNCAIIPAGSTEVILGEDATEEITIYQLMLQGVLRVRPDSKLTVQGNASLVGIKDEVLN